MVSPLLPRSLVRLLRSSPSESRLREGGFAGDYGIEKDRGGEGEGGCKRRRRKPRPEITASIPSRLSCSTLSDSRWNQFRSLSPSYASRFGGFPLSRLLRQDDLDNFAIMTQSYDLIASMNLRERKLLFLLSYTFTLSYTFIHTCMYFFFTLFYAHHAYYVHIIFFKRQLRSPDCKITVYFTASKKALPSHQTRVFYGISCRRDIFRGRYTLRQITKFMTFFDVFTASFLVHVLVFYFVAFFELVFAIAFFLLHIFLYFRP